MPVPTHPAALAHQVRALGTDCVLAPDGTYRGTGVSGLGVRVERHGPGLWECAVSIRGAQILRGTGLTCDDAIEACAAQWAFHLDGGRQMLEAHYAGTTVQRVARVTRAA